MKLGPAFPPAGALIEPRHLVAGELLVVIGPTHSAASIVPFPAQGRSLLRGSAAATTPSLAARAGKTADANFRPIEIGHGLDLLAEEAAHLAAVFHMEALVNVLNFL